MEIVINVVHGGFSLSPKAIKRLAQLNGKECYFYTSGIGEPYIRITEEAASREIMHTAFSVSD